MGWKTTLPGRRHKVRFGQKGSDHHRILHQPQFAKRSSGPHQSEVRLLVDAGRARCNHALQRALLAAIPFVPMMKAFGPKQANPAAQQSKAADQAGAIKTRGRFQC